MPSTRPWIKITDVPVNISAGLAPETYFAQNRGNEDLLTSAGLTAAGAPDTSTAPTKLYPPKTPFDLVVEEDIADWAWTYEGKTTYVVVE